jgi:hypothetical protein
MRPWERWGFNVCAALVVVSGIVYAWMQYVVTTDDPFALVNHPWQPAVLALHVLVSPPFLLMFGIVFNSHVMRKLQGRVRPNRFTGYASLATFGAMVGSGYALQVLSGDALLRWAVAVHLASGFTFAVTYGTHLLIAVLMRRPAQRRVPEVA